MKEINSHISGFYKLPIAERQQLISKMVELTAKEVEMLSNSGYLTALQLDMMIENVIGGYILPFGIACNFKINQKDYLIPMVIEEPSVVAAASSSCFWCAPDRRALTLAATAVLHTRSSRLRAARNRLPYSPMLRNLFWRRRTSVRG